MEVFVRQVVIECEQLTHPLYDSVFVALQVGGQVLRAAYCLHREKGSKRRTYNVDWPEIMVGADAFREGYAYVSVAVDEGLLDSHPHLPFLPTNPSPTSPNCAQVPLLSFMKGSFDVAATATLPTLGVPGAGVVRVVLHGNARMPAAQRTSRIMSMNRADLLNYTFEMLDDDIDGIDEEVQSEEEEEDKGVPQGQGRAQGNEFSELNRTLYPKASMARMSVVAMGLTTMGVTSYEGDAYVHTPLLDNLVKEER
ncbi:hypothetical protein B484DRAFT_435405 [Ochromonadaceae sp. CCMP2298]|nr:hypothetical protein B484DRAFT_435405 [Ochromonadaceae sp. CCMP2298]|mmetsp:Transcript_4889/g.11129  ORF Transcript_4889/g.11129 Transcript_4889/m.11129 type:complete len:253 (-) Transcript_4889:28-786(-)